MRDRECQMRGNRECQTKDREWQMRGEKEGKQEARLRRVKRRIIRSRDHVIPFVLPDKLVRHAEL